MDHDSKIYNVFQFYSASWNQLPYCPTQIHNHEILTGTYLQSTRINCQVLVIHLHCAKKWSRQSTAGDKTSMTLCSFPYNLQFNNKRELIIKIIMMYWALTMCQSLCWDTFIISKIKVRYYDVQITDRKYYDVQITDRKNKTCEFKGYSFRSS